MWGTNRTNSAGGDYKIVVCRKSPRSLDNLVFVIGDDFDALELYAEVETVFGEV
jgi:hypothetical protein